MQPPPPISFERQIASAGRSAQRSGTLFRLWLLTAGVNGRAVYEEPLRAYWDHIRFLEYGQLFGCVTEAHSLLSIQKGAITIPDLIKQARRREVDTADVSALLTEAAPITAKLGVLRHNAFAHRSRSYEYNDVFDVAQITPNEIGEGCGLALRCVNLLARKFDLPLTQMNHGPEESYERMLNALRTPGVPQVIDFSGDRVPFG